MDSVLKFQLKEITIYQTKEHRFMLNGMKKILMMNQVGTIALLKNIIQMAKQL